MATQDASNVRRRDEDRFWSFLHAHERHERNHSLPTGSTSDHSGATSWEVLERAKEVQDVLLLPRTQRVEAIDHDISLRPRITLAALVLLDCDEQI